MSLVIEYVLDGHKRGYNFTSSTSAYSEETLKTIWRQAMPRGQGWGRYVGAQSLKCFPLPNGHVAASTVTVTDQQDESGRRGIRYTVIDVVPPQAYKTMLTERLQALPAGVQRDARFQVEMWQRTRTVERVLNQYRKAEQLVLTHPYTTPADWQVVEGVLLLLALAPYGALRRWSASFPFTTLALEHRDEGQIVALPADKADTIKGVPVLRIA